MCIRDRSTGYVWDFGLNGRLATTSLWINASGGTIQAAIDPYTTTGTVGTAVRELLGQNASSSSGGNGFDTVDYGVRDADGNILTLSLIHIFPLQGSRRPDIPLSNKSREIRKHHY